MNHPAELSVHSYLRKAIDGKTSMSKEVIKAICDDVAAALEKQFNSGPRDEFRLRMSNIGRPKCQLWFDKNYPETDIQKPTAFMLNMLMGDWTEAIFKGILRAAKVEFEDNDRVTLKLEGGAEVSGEYDMIMDGAVDDVKSASPWSYMNKFVDAETLAKGDSFGYIPQLIGYAQAADKKVGGWWVINKGNGHFKYVSAASLDKEAVMADIQSTHDYITNDEPFERCFTSEPETYRGKASGNMKLSKQCGFCDHKKKCWPELQVLPSKVYQGKQTPPDVEYVQLAN